MLRGFVVWRKMGTTAKFLPPASGAKGGAANALLEKGLRNWTTRH